MKQQKPKFMMIYRCSSCGMDSGYSELDEPVCRYCDEPGEMTLVEKKEMTREVVSGRLKELSDRMLKNLQAAFESMTEEDKAAFPKGTDPEKEMLLLLAKAKKFKEDIEKIDFSKPKQEKDGDEKDGN